MNTSSLLGTLFSLSCEFTRELIKGKNSKQFFRQKAHKIRSKS